MMMPPILVVWLEAQVGFLLLCRCNVTDVPNVNAPRTEPPNITKMIITVISKNLQKKSPKAILHIFLLRLCITV